MKWVQIGRWSEKAHQQGTQRPLFFGIFSPWQYRGTTINLYKLYRSMRSDDLTQLIHLLVSISEACINTTTDINIIHLCIHIKKQQIEKIKQLSSPWGIIVLDIAVSPRNDRLHFGSIGALVVIVLVMFIWSLFSNKSWNDLSSWRDTVVFDTDRQSVSYLRVGRKTLVFSLSWVFRQTFPKG